MKTQLENTARSYGSVAKIFHWLIALLIITIVPVGLIANGMAQDIRDPSIASTAEDFTRVFYLFSLHKTLGVTIFLVALARILWALTQPRPGLLNPERRIEAFAAHTVHWLLYGSLVLVPLSGWIAHAATSGFAPIYWPFGQSLPFVPKDQSIATTFAGLHLLLGRVLLLAIILHIAGALKHHLFDRDQTLRRMLPGKSAPPMPPVQGHSLVPPIAALTLWTAAIATGFAIGIVPPLAPAPAAQDTLGETATGWQVGEGELRFSITQMGNIVEGRFDNWRADITFDETADPGPLGTVDVTIDITSLSLGAVTQQAMGPDFFDADFFSEASFSGEITRSETGYVATGPLTIRDTSLIVTLPFDLTIDGQTARMTGALSLNRLDFGVAANMPDETTLGWMVDVQIGLTATRR